jgi:predicted aspartyl protease
MQSRSLLTKRIPVLSAYFSNPKERKYILENAIIDTGATISAIPKSFVETLHLEEIGRTNVALISGGVIEYALYLCQITLKDRKRDTPVIAIDNLENAIIGMDVADDKLIRDVFIPEVISDTVNILQNIEVIKHNTVLILGQDTSEIYRLHAIKQSLEKFAYAGIIVKDLSDIEIQSTEEKVNMLASISRFVICDNARAIQQFFSNSIQQNNRQYPRQPANYFV